MPIANLPVGANCLGIVQSAGGDIGVDAKFSYENPTLTVTDPKVTQEALDAAVAAYDHEAYLLEQERIVTTKSINTEAAAKIEDLAPLYKQINEISNAITVLAEKLDLIGDPRFNEARILRDRINAVRKEAKAKKEALNARQNPRE